MRPAVLLRFYRLRTAARIAARQPIDVLVTLFAARKAKRSWIGALETDLKWVAESTHEFAEFLPLEGKRVAAYFRFCKQWPVAAFQALKKVVLKDGLTAAAATSYMAPVAVAPSAAGEAAPVAPAGHFVSATCKEVHTTYTALQMHQAPRHGKLSIPAHKIETKWCPICLMHFRTNTL